MHPAIRIVALLAAVVVLTTACGVKSAYNNADWLLMRWINDQVSLTSQQELAVRGALEEHLEWHCASELDAYSELLRSIDRDVANDQATLETLAEYNNRVAEFGRRILVRVKPTLIDLLASLSDEQVEEFMASFEERNRELAEEAERSEEQRRQDRVDALKKGMRRFSVRPTSEQNQRIEAWAASLSPTAKPALEEQLARQVQLRDALAMRDDRAGFERAMSSLLEPGSTQSSEYRQRRNYNQGKTQRAILDLHQMASQEQRERFRERLTDWARKFEELSCR